MNKIDQYRNYIEDLKKGFHPDEGSYYHGWNDALDAALRIINQMETSIIDEFYESGRQSILNAIPKVLNQISKDKENAQ